MADISLPGQVTLPPGSHVKRVILTFPEPLVGRQPLFYFDTKKHIFELVQSVCETNEIPDYVKYSFKWAESNDQMGFRFAGKYITEKNKNLVADGQTLLLCESTLTVATRLTFELRRENVQEGTLLQVLQLLRSADDDFANNFASQTGIRDLNQLISTKGVTSATATALQCLVYLFKIVDCSNFGDLSAVSAICSELQKNRKNIEPGSFTAKYIAASFQVLTAFLEKNVTEIHENFPVTIHYVATTYLEPTCCAEIVSSVMLFLNRFLERHPEQLVSLLNGKPSTCVNLRKSIANVLPAVSSDGDVAEHAVVLFQRIMDKEASDWLKMVTLEAKIDERLTSIGVLVEKLAGLAQPCLAHDKLVGFTEICPKSSELKQDLASLMALSLLEYLLKKWPAFFAQLKAYNLDVPECKIPLGSLALALTRHVLENQFSKQELSIATIRIVFCAAGDSVDESSYDTLFAKLLDLAVSTWKLMEGGRTPADRVIAVICEQIDFIFKEPLKSQNEVEFDDHIQRFSYNHMRHLWLQQQVDGFERVRNGDIGHRLQEVFEPFAFALIKRQRLAALTLGKSFTKIPRTQGAEWPCRYFRLSTNGKELSYQDLEETSHAAPSSLQYSIVCGDIREIMDGEQLARPPKYVNLATCFGMHRVVPKENDSESTDRDEKFFFEAPDVRTCVLWKDGLRLFIDLNISKDRLSEDFRSEVKTVVQLEVLARLSELIDFSNVPDQLPESFFRPPDDVIC